MLARANLVADADLADDVVLYTQEGKQTEYKD
jgi:hypothetical protein